MSKRLLDNGRDLAEYGFVLAYKNIAIGQASAKATHFQAAQGRLGLEAGMGGLCQSLRRTCQGRNERCHQEHRYSLHCEFYFVESWLWNHAAAEPSDFPNAQSN
jgi:hypothetical protein